LPVRVCRSELCRELKVFSRLCRIFSTGLRVGIADWFELLREHQQDRILVDEVLVA
jgi:hypothetical protein